MEPQKSSSEGKGCKKTNPLVSSFLNTSGRNFLKKRIYRKIEKVSGTENLEGIFETLKKESAIIACNHISHADPFILSAVVDKISGGRKCWLLTSENIYSLLDNIRIGYEIREAGGMISRLHNGCNEGGILELIKLLKNKNCCGIFPEGFLNYHSALTRAHKGIGRMVLSTEKDIPVIPVGIKGFQPPEYLSDEQQMIESFLNLFNPMNHKKYGFRREKNGGSSYCGYSLWIGKPLFFEKEREIINGDPDMKNILRGKSLARKRTKKFGELLDLEQSLADDIMVNIGKLIGKQYDPNIVPPISGGRHLCKYEIVEPHDLESLEEIIEFNNNVFNVKNNHKDKYRGLHLKDYLKKISCKSPLIYRAIIEDELVGDCISFEENGSLNVWLVAIDEKYRGRKIASKLLRLTEKYAKEKGYCSLKMEIPYYYKTALDIAINHKKPSATTGYDEYHQKEYFFKFDIK